MPDHTDAELRNLQTANHYAQLLRDYVDTFTTAHGARVLEDLRSRCFADRSTLTTPTVSGPVDVYRTIWNEGARGAYLGIVDRVEKGRRMQHPQPTHAVGTLTPEGVEMSDGG